MKKGFLIVAFMSLLTTSCKQNSSGSEREYIQNLEEKNKALEKELQEIRGKESKEEVHQNRNQKKKDLKGYFTIGSTEDEVLELMGDPSKYLDIASFGKRFYYGLSVVVFEKGKVVSYDTYDGNLKVRVKD